MKELLLLRHAKSSWDDPTLDDFDRPLAPRGLKAAPLMGRAIAARAWVPQRALVSSARRARQTWNLVAAELGEEAPPPEHAKSLYMATPDRLLAAIRRVPEHIGRLLLLGHNPGLEELALGLAGAGSDETALARLRAKFPTAALARYELEGPWSDLGLGAARLTHLLLPRDLRRTSPHLPAAGQRS